MISFFRMNEIIYLHSSRAIYIMSDTFFFYRKCSELPVLKDDSEYDQMTLKKYIDPFAGEPVNLLFNLVSRIARLLNLFAKYDH